MAGPPEKEYPKPDLQQSSPISDICQVLFCAKKEDSRKNTSETTKCWRWKEICRRGPEFVQQAIICLYFPRRRGQGRGRRPFRPLLFAQRDPEKIGDKFGDLSSLSKKHGNSVEICVN